MMAGVANAFLLVGPTKQPSANGDVLQNGALPHIGS
jgi:hypothetical protein